jgi:opacity protein-like surface antigen
MRKLVVTAFVGILIAAAPVSAQDYKPVDFNFGFGWAFPQTEFKDSFNTGWNGTFGVTFNINENLGVGAEYMYNYMSGPERVIDVFPTPNSLVGTSGLIESNHQMHVGSFNLVYKMQATDSPVGGYVLGGPGVYHRTVQLTTPTVGYTTICDPYWYVCYPGLVSVDQIIGDRSSTDFGMDLGAGVTFGREAKFYIETRYHYVWGKEITPSASQLPAGASTSTTCASGCSTNASYYPLTLGFRW